MSQSQLRKDLEKKLGRSIRTKNDAIALESAIFEDTGLLVSYNTIRRFFGLVNGGQARESVLDIYAQFLGHKNYKAFEDNKKRFEFYSQWTMVSQRSHWSLEHIHELVYEALNENRAAQGQLLWVMSNVFKDEPIEEWNRWFSVGAWVVEQERFGHLLFIIDNLGAIIRERIRTEEDAEKLLSFPVLVERLVLLFVDYSTLTDGYYQKVIQLLSKNDEYTLFTSSLLGLQSLLRGDFEKAKDHYMQTAAYPVDYDLYPILNSRILGAQVYLDWFNDKRMDPKTYQQIIALIENTPEAQYDLAVMELLPIAAVLGMTNEVISIDKMYSDGDKISSDWSVLANLDLIRISAMIAYARAGMHEKVEELNTELRPETWYAAYSNYLKALHAFTQTLSGHETVQFSQTLHQYPGLKSLI